MGVLSAKGSVAEVSVVSGETLAGRRRGSGGPAVRGSQEVRSDGQVASAQGATAEPAGACDVGLEQKVTLTG